MLILTRKSNESIVFFVNSNNNEKEKILVKILETHGNKVRIGVSAPKDVVVVREEILEEMSG